MKPLQIFIFLALLLVGIIFWVVQDRRTQDSQITPAPNPSFPIATSSSQSNTGGKPQSTLNIAIQNGGNMLVKDFIRNGITIPDPQNEGRYLLAGSLGYCLPDAPCTAGQATSFNIFYDQTTSTFTIGLLKEPLSASRKAAEVFLENALGAKPEQLCALKYYIGTTYTVNESYAGDSLGFSACPGAVKLP